MFNLTQQERLVLLFISGVVLVGSLLQIISKESAGIRHFLEYMEQSRALSKVDLNSADERSLERVPYIGKATAAAIIQFREERGGFKTVDELLLVHGIGPRKFELIEPHVKVGR